ncbi:hypothetical protein BKA65DRAFT_590821 [Rhexocercosporidium sp. MPI-PUGE-AT-0058]|nr:hypothetical protein BKA65DRAFT_590821 [Rhexocercosporidium sp. MPI-PUGE-AT-0058]
MLPPAPTCRRALQRQLYTPSDSVWISDEALSLVFQRFCAVSKTRKRYGSFVPGPLESRRRLGKRRMTLQSNAAPAPAFGIAALWGSFGEVDRTKWQWEAPSAQNPGTEAATSALPRWLVEWGTASETLPDPSIPTISKSRKRAKALASFREETRSFQRALKVCIPEDMPALCDEFNRKLTQTLSLGLQAEQNLLYTMKFTLHDIQEAFSDPSLASQQCLALCQAMWKGISTSKVIQPSDLGDKTMSRFLAILCEIPMSEGLQTLAGNMFSMVTATQLQKIHSSIARLVASWVLSWQVEDAQKCDESGLAVAAQRVVEATHAVASVENLTVAMQRSSCLEQDLQAFRLALQRAREAIELSAEAIQEAEHRVTPHQHSAKALTVALGCLPNGILRTIVHQCSTRFSKYANNTMETSSVPVQHSWLSLIAQLPNVNETLLLETWRKSDAMLRQGSAADIILNHWISQDLIKRPALTRMMFDVTTSQRGRKDQSTLLYVIDRERENCWDKMRLLFGILDKLGHHESIHTTLLHLNRLRVKVPADIIDVTLERMAINDPLLAQKTFRLYGFMRYNDVPLRIERCPNFVVSMIDNPDFSPRTIWMSLGIPLYESLPSRALADLVSNKSRHEKHLSPALVEHFTRMATVFAHCTKRTQRAAFRNVMQCLFHLRKHNAPITPKFTRAMVHAGITRKILSDGWIAKERSAWLLELIEQVEGTDVAVTVHEVVEAWNQHVSARVSRRDRDLNVLGVGPID